MDKYNVVEEFQGTHMSTTAPRWPLQFLFFILVTLISYWFTQKKNILKFIRSFSTPHRAYRRTIAEILNKDEKGA